MKNKIQERIDYCKREIKNAEDCGENVSATEAGNVDFLESILAELDEDTARLDYLDGLETEDLMDCASHFLSLPTVREAIDAHRREQPDE